MDEEVILPQDDAEAESDGGRKAPAELPLPPLPVSADPLQAYLAQVRQIPLLTPEEWSILAATTATSTP